MKEATGELNMTVVTVVAIGAIGAFFAVFVWPSIQANIERSTKCAAAYNCTPTGDGTSLSCSYSEDSSGTGNVETITCPNNDATN